MQPAKSYRCRMVIPEEESGWEEIEAATPEDAANTYHDCLYHLGRRGLCYIDERGGPGRRTEVYFARIEVEGFGSWVSRIFREGLYRKGGVIRSGDRPTLTDIAQRLEWPSAPERLADDKGWVGSEWTWD